MMVESVFGAFAFIIVACVGCATFLVAYILNRVLGRSRRAHEEDLKELRNTIVCLDDVVRRLERRLENMETVVAGSDYQARQRIARALDESNTTASAGAPPERARQTVVTEE